jgi:hypothetical protein
MYIASEHRKSGTIGDYKKAGNDKVGLVSALSVPRPQMK